MIANAAQLETFLTPYADSGREEAYAVFLEEQLRQTGLCCDVTRDRMNNVIAQIGTGEKPYILLDAHFDEISFLVRRIDSSGFLQVSGVGGVDRRCLPAAKVSVNGLDGVFCSVPPHLMLNQDRRFPEVSEMYVDLGLDYETVCARVQIGDRVRLKSRFYPLLGNRLSGRALDNKLSVYALFVALKKLADSESFESLAWNIAVLFSAQEETGLRGAGPGVFSICPERALCVDATFADQPGVKDCPPLGSGVVIERSAFFDRNFTRSLMDLAEEHQLPHTVHVQAGASGTNADILPFFCGGIPTALLSIPIRNMHTPVEVCDLADVEATADLICAYLKEGPQG